MGVKRPLSRRASSFCLDVQLFPCYVIIFDTRRKGGERNRFLALDGTLFGLHSILTKLKSDATSFGRNILWTPYFFTARFFYPTFFYLYFFFTNSFFLHPTIFSTHTILFHTNFLSTLTFFYPPFFYSNFFTRILKLSVFFL